MSIKNIHKDIRETHIVSSGTRICVVRADESDSRDWLAGRPICNRLDDYHIAHCGIMHASHPFEIVRLNLSGTFFFVCIEGKGKVLIDGEWRTVSAGQACLQPPFIPNAVKAFGRSLWKFCWVRYQDTPQSKSLVSLHAPALGMFDGAPMQFAIEGLHAEATGTGSQHLLRKWTDLVQSYVQLFAQPFRGDERLIKVWQVVESRLNEDWSLDRLAQIACVSKEHLRRLCTKTLGRSPIQHITFLRMQHAAEMLATTNQKIGQIAHQVGYANQFAFSDTFQRWLGCRPSVYREQGIVPK